MSQAAVQSKAEVLEWLRAQGDFAAPQILEQRERLHRNQVLSTGSTQLDALLGGGFRRGAITELVGPSGRMSLALHCLAALHRQNKADAQTPSLVAWIDVGDGLDPRTLKSCGLSLDHFLWIRPSALRQGLKACDLLLDAGGFAVVVLDVSGFRLNAQTTRPAWWVRLARRLEEGRTVLLNLGEVGGFCSVARIDAQRMHGAGFELRAKVVRQRYGQREGVAKLLLGGPCD